MARVVSLYLPTWATDRRKRRSGVASPQPEGGLALAAHDGRRRVIVAADLVAQQAGVRIGMPATKAQVLVPGLALEDADLGADLESLDALAGWMLRYSPIVAADAPDGVVLDTTGADHLRGGEEAMLEGLVVRLAASGFDARAAVADTWGVAHALARFGPSRIVIAEAGLGEVVIASLPLGALRLPTKIVAGLRTLGFDTVGNLLAQPRAPLVLRFGPELGRRLDQALGQVREPIDPIRLPDIVEVRRAFAEPIGAPETIARCVGKLVGDLCKQLEAQGLGVRHLDLICERVDSRTEAARVMTATPVRDARRLTRLLIDKIETIDPGFGIEIMSLAATLAEPLANTQHVASLVEPAVPDVSGLIDTLVNRVGERRLYRIAPVASDVPERSVRKIRPMATETGESWSGEWPRPSRLLAPAEPIETVALLPDHPPVTFSWRGVRRRVKRADGPERIFGEWWRRDAELSAVRDYFRVEDEAGERYWIYRAGDGEDPGTGSHRWFVHGIFG
jgi:protein ImuB